MWYSAALLYFWGCYINPYDRYGVEHWKNPHAKIFYIRKQKEPGKPKEVIYSNSKIIQVIKTYWELGHEHKFITKIVARRTNDCIVSITEPDYKNLNKNDIEDMYLLIMNGKVPDYPETGLLWSLSVFIKSSVIWERVHDFQLGIESYQHKVNLTAPTISFPGVKKHKMFSIIYEPMHGVIYKNSKKEKRVMRHSEIHKDLTNEEVEYLKLFEEEIEVRLKYRNQMRRWEMTKKYEELSVAKKLQADCNLKATNIILQGLPPNVYAIVNHHKVAKDIWDRVKLLMQGTKLSLQEKECKLYDEFDKFSFVKGETLYKYYWRFAQLINNMNVINMSMRPVQVNTKVLNSLPPE
ncbi:hypothetical protein Tco_1230147 [Tanacetum coccineum]